MKPTGMDLIRAQKGLMSQIAAELGIVRGAVNQWRRVPAERVPEVARITGYSRHQLRPDLWEPDEAPPRRCKAAA
jgi:DNA-binding transcriptional regulator YdaS (Cro superfamily)